MATFRMATTSAHLACMTAQKKTSFNNEQVPYRWSALIFSLYRLECLCDASKCTPSIAKPALCALFIFQFAAVVWVFTLFFGVGNLQSDFEIQWNRFFKEHKVQNTQTHLTHKRTEENKSKWCLRWRSVNFACIQRELALAIPRFVHSEKRIQMILIELKENNRPIWP